MQPEHTMNSFQVDTTWTEDTPVVEAPRKIQEASHVEVPSPAAPDGEGFPRRFANEAHNSRISGDLPEGRWEIQWKTELDDEFFPDVLLTHGRRILLEGYSRWQLYDTKGELLATSRRGPSEVVLDGSHSLLYALDSIGYLSAWSLREGELAFHMPVDFGDQFSRPFIVRRGQRLITVGIGRALQPHARPENRSFVEVIDLGDSLQIDEDDILISLRTRTRLTRCTRLLLTALQGDTLVIATQDRIYRADFDLQLQRAFTGTFTPKSVSLDEAVRIYLIVSTETDTGEERQALWVVTPDGEQRIDVEIPEHPEGTYTPPIIGYNHQVYILLGDRIMAISPKGDVRWTERVGVPISGAVVTANDRLLVSAGAYLFAFGVDGTRTVVFGLEDGEWATPAIVTERGRLLAASKQYLYCLGVVE